MVRVWDWPLRAYHWALAFFVLLAWFTPTKHDGLHRFAGYAVIVLIVFRLAWGVYGSHFSRFHTIGRRLRAAPAFVANLRHGKTGRYRGLNPAGAAMLVVLLLLLAVSTVSGWLSTTVTFFGVPWVEDTHSYVSDAVMVFVVIHVLGVLAMCLLQRENLVRSMFQAGSAATLSLADRIERLFGRGQGRFRRPVTLGDLHGFAVSSDSTRSALADRTTQFAETAAMDDGRLAGPSAGAVRLRLHRFLGFGQRDRRP